ncbi:type 1 glutamine amidotransferase [Aliiroseovarius sp.]|uniref:type 1 glutamine amidotransferase n=1 Tax=Aliiroseovarius sp. TaxID=1872442 RepID=UPI003BAB24D4
MTAPHPPCTILIVESNSPEITAGRLAATPFVETLAALDPRIGTRIVAPYEAPLEEVEGVDGIIFTGSGVNWSVDAPEAAPLRDAMELALGAGAPIWGSCNGLQLAALVLGGAVGASPKGQELGLARDMTLTDAGAGHAMMAGRAAGFAAPCLHRDEVQRLPEGAQLLAGNDHSPVQAMVYEQGGVRFWGTQYHPEMSPRSVADGLRGYGLFQDRLADLEALEQAEEDADAARRLGSSPAELAPPNRARELANWLDFVRN